MLVVGDGDLWDLSQSRLALSRSRMSSPMYLSYICGAHSTSHKGVISNSGKGMAFILGRSGWVSLIIFNGLWADVGRQRMPSAWM